MRKSAPGLRWRAFARFYITNLDVKKSEEKAVWGSSNLVIYGYTGVPIRKSKGKGA
ncbi:hypothetical protein [Paenibacillus sp. 7516]|uniref:hypothetical protein n=1 Tax=Paenibacillus sp. 7516 TaxID=2022549 RepID=UPI0014820CCB|nr:hypothetical protein [Paenibacillus sp. 7516]